MVKEGGFFLVWYSFLVIYNSFMVFNCIFVKVLRLGVSKLCIIFYKKMVLVSFYLWKVFNKVVFIFELIDGFLIVLLVKYYCCWIEIV